MARPAMAPGALARQRAMERREGLREWAARRQGLLLFVAGSLFFLGIAAWLSFGVELALGDALSRTLSAIRAEHSRYPRLAELGFIWPPLPTLLQLILVVFPQMGYYGFSGGIISALAAGLLLLSLNNALRWSGVGAKWRVAVLALFVLNPMWLFYAGNGMSEMPFLLFFTFSCFSFVRWQATGEWRDLALAGMGTALMFACRYDAIPYAGVFAAAVAVVFVFQRKPFNRTQVEASLFAYLVPSVYAVGLWLYFNYLIMGDPLYFLRNPYSNNFIVRNVATNPAVIALQGSLGATGQFFVVTILALSPLLLALLPVCLTQLIRRRDMRIVAVLMVLLAVPLFQLYSYRAGQTFGFLRFFISLQPAGVLLAVTLLRDRQGRVRKIITGTMLATLALAVVTSGAAMQKTGPLGLFNDMVVFEESDFVGALQHPFTAIDNYGAARDAGNVLHDRFADKPVLIMGDISVDEVVLFSAIPERFVGPSDPDFQTALLDPARKVDYLLVTQAAADDPRYMALKAVYPHIYEAGLRDFVLDSEIGPYRLYRSTLRGTP